jgi:hypothetical protein
MASSVEAIAAMRQRCFDVYHREFSRKVQVDRWQQLLTQPRLRPAVQVRKATGKVREERAVNVQ